MKITKVKSSKKKKKEDSGLTTYDKVFKTLIMNYPEFGIALVNKAFGYQIPLDQKVENLNGEMVISLPGGRMLIIITDSNYQIGEESRHNNGENQTSPDPLITLRIGKYSLGDSLSTSYTFGNMKDGFRMCRSFLIQLRGWETFPDRLSFCLSFDHAPESSDFPPQWLNGQEEERDQNRFRDYGSHSIDTTNGNVFVNVPVMKPGAWTIDSLCQDVLYGLFPYLAFRYEAALAKKEPLPQSIVEALVQLSKDLIDKLDELVENQTISEGLYQGLRGYSITVNHKLMKNHLKELEEVFIQLGKLEDYECPAEVQRKALLEGEAKGIEKGREEGREEGIAVGMAKAVLNGYSKKKALSLLDKKSKILFNQYLKNPNLIL